jgi:hypothetical protein
MPTILTQNWLANLLFPIVALTIVSLSASAVSRHRWFSIRPVLSTYIWFLATIGGLSLIVYFVQVPETFRYTACRIYFVIYYATVILMCFFSVAVIYEFLFRMAGTDKAIQRAAVFGFVITMSAIAALTYGLMRQAASTTETLEQGARLLNASTAMALLVSGSVVFAIKKRRSLFLETRLSMVLTALALYNFIDLLIAFILRRIEPARLVVADMMWVGFSILLYWALKNGPATTGVVACKSELR